MLQGIIDFFKYAIENALQTGLMVGALITVLGSYIVGYQQDKQQKELQKKISANQEQTIDQLKKSLIEQRNLILGGDSYLYLQLSQIAQSQDFILKFNFVGEYPLYDTKLKINEYDLIQDNGKITSTNLRSFDVDLLTVHSIVNAQIFRKFSLKQSNGVIGRRYFIVGNARNGTTEQDIVVYIDRSGKTQEAVKVITVAPSYSANFGDFPYGGSKRRVKSITDGFDMSLLGNNTNGDHGWKRTDYERNF